MLFKIYSLHFLVTICFSLTGEIIRVSTSIATCFSAGTQLMCSLILRRRQLSLNCLQPAPCASPDARVYVHTNTCFFNIWLPVISVWFSHYSTVNSLSVPFGSLTSQVGCRQPPLRLWITPCISIANTVQIPVPLWKPPKHTYTSKYARRHNSRSSVFEQCKKFNLSLSDWTVVLNCIFLFNPQAWKCVFVHTVLKRSLSISPPLSSYWASSGKKHKTEIAASDGILVSLITHSLFKIWNYCNHTEIWVCFEKD